MTVLAMGGQRGVRRSKDRLNLLPAPGCLALLSLGSVSKSGCTWSREKPPLQTNLNVSCWRKNQPGSVSCPSPHAADPLRSQHRGSHRPTGGWTRAPSPWAAWVINFKHFWLWHSVQQNKNKTCALVVSASLRHFFISKVSPPFKI